MADFTQTIESKYGVDTYQETKNTYDWIIKAIISCNYPNQTINEDFLFDIGKISCGCDSIEEFVENAYEQSDYSLVYMNLTWCFGDKENVYIHVKHDGKIRVTAGSKNILLTRQ